MLPCRTFVKLFLHGDIDPDWQYILRGVVFGFRIMNPDCNVTYSAKPKKENSEIMTFPSPEEVSALHITFI